MNRPLHEQVHVDAMIESAKAVVPSGCVTLSQRQQLRSGQSRGRRENKSGSRKRNRQSEQRRSHSDFHTH